MHSHNRTLLASLGFSDADKRDPRHDLAGQYLALQENHMRLALKYAQARDGKPMSSRVWDGRSDSLFNFTRKSTAELRAPQLEHAISKGSGQYKTTIGFADAMLPFLCRWVDTGRIHGWVLTGKTVEVEAPWHVTRIPSVASMQNGDSVEMEIGHDVRLPDDGPSKRRVSIRRRDDQIVMVVPTMERGWVDHVCDKDEWGSRRAFEIYVEVKIGPVGIGDVLRQINLYREHVGTHDDETSRVWILATPYPLSAFDVATLRTAKVDHIRLGEKFDAWAAEKMASAADGESPEF